MIRAPKPPSRPDNVPLREYLRLFRQDILSAQPARLYRAWMAEFRTPFFTSYMINQPDLLDTVLKERPDDFPKSDRIREGLAPLLGESVFVTNGETWKRQRRIIDPSFEGGKLRESFPAMVDAAESLVARLATQTGTDLEVEEEASHAAADVIFRTLFSIPIDHRIARDVFAAFKDHQRTQPLLNIAAFLPFPHWLPRPHKRQTRETARRIRHLITDLTAARAEDIAAGTAPQDLATRIMTTADPVTGERFETEEMVDQVAIFFLAGHETSASALAWGLYLLAIAPEVQDRVAEEAQAAWTEPPDVSDLSRLAFTRDVFRETLRLYPPVPMMVREATQQEQFRNRTVSQGAQIVLSPWHLHRHERLWEDPDSFDPDRWQRPETKESQRAAYMPFSAGPRVCTGASFAMAEGVLLLAAVARAFVIEPVQGREPVPVAHLTVRSKDGIWLRLRPR